MQRLAAFLPLLLTALMLFSLSDAAEAKRFGYGGNMGRQYSAPQRSAPAAAPRQNDAPNAAVPRQSGMNRWLGPLAGLAAGGLLASLFFGDAFNGIQMMDMLLIAALVIGALWLFRSRRPQPALRTASGPVIGGDLSDPVTGSASPAAHADAPAWFDARSFDKNARTHFIRLQAAWDKGDMKDIAEYTTPELFASLQAERLSRGDERHFTEVAFLDTELLGTQRDGDKLVVSIRFFGGIREEQNGPAENFSEIWHVSHAWDSAQGDWYVAGIQQA